MEKLLSKERNPDGLHMKYYVEKINGAMVDKESEYFLLRVDPIKEEDSVQKQAHKKASRIAMITYAKEIALTNPKLAEDILNRYE